MRLRVLLTALCLPVAGCTSSSTASCGDTLFEALDPQSIIHVVTDEGITYSTDPPTSGPHASGAIPSGQLDAPIGPALQVAILERGDVIVHYRPQDVATVQLQDVEDERIVTIPNPDLASAVIVTAWQHKLICSSWDAEEVLEFRATHGANGATHD